MWQIYSALYMCVCAIPRHTYQWPLSHSLILISILDYVPVLLFALFTYLSRSLFLSFLPPFGVKATPSAVSAAVTTILTLNYLIWEFGCEAKWTVQRSIYIQHTPCLLMVKMFSEWLYFIHFNFLRPTNICVYGVSMYACAYVVKISPIFSSLSSIKKVLSLWICESYGWRTMATKLYLFQAYITTFEVKSTPPEI